MSFWTLRQVKRHIKELKPDERHKTSPENGKKGGRPEVSYSEQAELFAEENIHQGMFKYKVYHGQWYRYDGIVYIPISDSDIEAKVMEFLQRREKEDSEIRASVNLRKNVIENLAVEKFAAVPSEKSIPYWINSQGQEDASGWMVMKNGIVNIENLAKRFNGETTDDSDIFRPHTPGLFTTFAVNYTFDLSAECPKWMEYLQGAQPDQENQEILQMLFGLSLVPDTSYEVVFIFYGDGGTGKSVCLYVLEELVGSRNVCCLPLNKMGEKFSMHLLAENLLNIVGELPTSTSRKLF